MSVRVCEEPQASTQSDASVQLTAAMAAATVNDHRAFGMHDRPPFPIRPLVPSFGTPSWDQGPQVEQAAETANSSDEEL